MEVDRNGLEVLERHECLRLLAGGTVGRLALTSRALPTILPVNYVFDSDRAIVAIRTGAGSKLDAAARNAVVAFEADDFDPSTRTGWSVVVVGIAKEVVDAEVLAGLEADELIRWAPTGDGHVLAISTEHVTGRRLRHPARAPDAST